MIKRITNWLFGWKLPCGHIRCRSKLGEIVACPVCFNSYFRVRFICKEPRRAGVMMYQGDLEQ